MAGRSPAQRSVLRNVLQGLQGGALGDESPSGGGGGGREKTVKVMKRFRKKTDKNQPPNLCLRFVQRS